MAPGENLIINELGTIPVKGGVKVNWQTLLDLYPGNFRAGLSHIELTKPDGGKIVGYLSMNPLDESDMEIMSITFDGETLLKSDIADLTSSITRGSINAIIDPTTFNPGQTPSIDTRYLILEDIVATVDGPSAWQEGQGHPFNATANDIIQFDGTKWNVIFNSSTVTDVTYITNSYTGIQYK